MEKKKILFICSNLNVGGVQKSLVSLLNSFDYEKYSVDLLLTYSKGQFLKYIPNDVNIISIPEYYYINIKNMKLSNFFSHPIHFTCKILASLFFRFDKCLSAWISSRTFFKIDKFYDVAVDYAGQSLLYYLVDRVRANRKITFFHNDYKKWDYYKKYDTKYYKQVDYIATVSKQCVLSMQEVFPECKNKIYCIENITTLKIIDMFCSHINPYEKESYDKTIIVTIGRVCKQKGNDIAIETANLLKQNHIDFLWYVIGPFEDEHEGNCYIEKIKEYRLENHYIFLGAMDNPYDYISYADIIAQPSRFEGKAISIDEAQILKKVVVATDFTTVHDQIINEKTGIITEMDSASFAEGLMKVIKNPNLKSTIEYNLKDKVGNGEEINKLYKLF